MHFFQEQEGHFHFHHIVHVTNKYEKRLKYDYMQHDVLLFCRKTRGTILINNQVFTIHSSSSFFIPVNSVVELNITHDQNGELYIVFFDMYSPLQFEPAKYLLQAHSGIFELLREFYLQNQLVATDLHLQNSVLLAKLMLEFARQVGQGWQEKSIEIVKEYIDLHYTESIQIPLLAAKLGVSEQYFMELFKKEYGSTVIDYVTKRRIEEAKRLLATGKFSVKEVGSVIGYNDEFYFSRRFKKMMKLSPSHFAKTRKRRIAILDSSIFNILTPLYYVPVTAPIHPTWRAYYFKKYELQIEQQLLIGRDAVIFNENLDSLLTSGERYDFIITIHPVPEHLLGALQKLGDVIQIQWERPWRWQLLEMAEVLGEEALAKEWLVYYEQLVKNLKSKLTAAVTGPFLFLLVKDAEVYLYKDRNIREVIEADLGHGIVLPTGEGEYKRLNLERMMKVQPFAIFILLYDDEASFRTWDILQKDDIWLELEAVRENRVYMLSSFPWRDYGAQAHYLMLEELNEYL